MTPYLLRRLLLAVPVMLGVVTIVFFLIHLIPGDPVEIMLGEGATEGAREDLRQRLGLDQPVIVQYGGYLASLAQGDLGESYSYRRPVTQLILERYPATLLLAIASMLVAAAVSFPLGVAAALRHRGSVDALSTFVALLGVSMPNFWLGPMLILIFALHLDLFPVSGMGSGLAVLPHLVLPAVTLGTSLAAILTRMTRSSMLEEISSDYVRTARAKGLPASRVVWKHALRNAMVPVLTILGLQFGILLTGAIITEKIFTWPGLGLLLIQAVFERDYRVVQGCVLVIALSTVLVNLVTDLTYAAVDPRIRYR